MPAEECNLVLASKSPYRAQLLRAAGLAVEIHPADIDERAIEAPLIETDINQADIPAILAQAKAVSVSEMRGNDIIIGSDQTLVFEDRQLHKPENMEQARRRLLAFSGKTHYLHSAVALAKDGEIIWHHTQSSTVTFRKLTPQFVGRHLAHVGGKALSSVGAYHIEGLGIQLFEKVEGDFFSIMGLPILPLLKELRRLEIIDG